MGTIGIYFILGKSEIILFGQAPLGVPLVWGSSWLSGILLEHWNSVYVTQEHQGSDTALGTYQYIPPNTPTQHKSGNAHLPLGSTAVETFLAFVYILYACRDMCGISYKPIAPLEMGA